MSFLHFLSLEGYFGLRLYFGLGGYFGLLQGGLLVGLELEEGGVEVKSQEVHHLTAGLEGESGGETVFDTGGQTEGEEGQEIDCLLHIYIIIVAQMNMVLFSLSKVYLVPPAPAQVRREDLHRTPPL